MSFHGPRRRRLLHPVYVYVCVGPKNLSHLARAEFCISQVHRVGAKAAAAYLETNVQSLNCLLNNFFGRRSLQKAIFNFVFISLRSIFVAFSLIPPLVLAKTPLKLANDVSYVLAALPEIQLWPSFSPRPTHTRRGGSRNLLLPGE